MASPDPILHVVAGPNGSGRTTFATRVLQPVTHLRFVNADEIAAQRWSEATPEHAYEASRLAARERDRLVAKSTSFITETVFSHPSKVDLVQDAMAAGYHVHLHVILLPEDAAVKRVGHRVSRGGHAVPEAKIRERYRRLWALVAQARDVAERTRIHDNSRARTPFQLVATYEHGRLIGEAHWPAWAPAALRAPRGTLEP